MEPQSNAANRVTRNARGWLNGFALTLKDEGNAAATAHLWCVRLLETVALISPLLDLPGTELGMIQAYRDFQMACGSANAALLAGSVWQSRNAKAAGLVVAIPTAEFFTARAEAATFEPEQIVRRLTGIVEGPWKKTK